MKKNKEDIKKEAFDTIADNVPHCLMGKMDSYRQNIHTQAVEAEYKDYEKGVDTGDKDYEEEEWKKASNDQEFRDIYEAIRRYQYENGATSGKPRKVHYSDDEIKDMIKNTQTGENVNDKLDKDTLNNTNKKWS